jgi:hypothetical protein
MSLVTTLEDAALAAVKTAAVNLPTPYGATAQALIAGSVTVSGDGFETVTVNFNRDPVLTVDISTTGTNVPWQASPSASTYYSLPTQNIETWSQLILQKGGRAPTDIVFTTGAFILFVADQRVQQSVWYLRSGDSKVEFGGQQPVQGAVYKGEWGGYRLWVYNDWYVDQVVGASWGSGATTITMPQTGTTLVVGSTLAPGNGIPIDCVVTNIVGTTVTINTATTAAASNAVLSWESPMIPGNGVVLASSALEGVRAFGSIMDPEFEYGAMAYAPKSWIQPNPAQRYIMMQSAPIVIPSRVNASFFAKVA